MAVELGVRGSWEVDEAAASLLGVVGATRSAW